MTAPQELRRVIIRRATRSDIPTVVDLWQEAARWLKDQGSEQWQYPIKMHNVERAIDDGTCWIIDGEDSCPVGTVTLDQSADPDLWRPEDVPDDALYVHRLVVSLEFRSGEIGSAALDWASKKARTLGKSWLRLDVWTSNNRLRQYYLDRGFTLVRVVPGLEYGALFQREAGALLHRGPVITEHETPGL